MILLLILSWIEKDILNLNMWFNLDVVAIIIVNNKIECHYLYYLCTTTQPQHNTHTLNKIKHSALIILYLIITFGLTVMSKSNTHPPIYRVS